jgi:hypothetical protein
MEEVNKRTKALFSLLWQEAGTDKQSDFWIRLNELNDRLMDCLSDPLALEEMRATLWALEGVSDETQQRIINEVYPEKRKNQEAQIFHTLRSLTGDCWPIALALTFLVEYLNPADPQNELEKLLRELNARKADTWSDEQWDMWLSSKKELEIVGDAFDKNDETLGNFMYAGVYIYPDPFLNNKTRIICEAKDNKRILLFFESMRQQLTNLDRIRSFVCPFKEQTRTCCGFGNYLRGLWSSIPYNYRVKLNPPVTDCLMPTEVTLYQAYHRDPIISQAGDWFHGGLLLQLLLTVLVSAASVQ